MTVEMEMTARLGLKVASFCSQVQSATCRNGDDSPVGIESAATFVFT